MLKRLLRYRVAHGKLIPPEARVDSAAFPEAEYPVVCPKCRYLLRGLPNGPCPECGKPFDRGRLLVEQYVLEGGSRFHPWTARMNNWALLIILGGPLVTWLGGTLLLARFTFDPTSPSNGVFFTLLDLLALWTVILSLGVVLALVSTVLSVRMFLRYRHKARQVFEAIDVASSRPPDQDEE